MPQNGYSVGRDTTVSLSIPGYTITPAKVTRFSKKQDTTEKKVKLMSGITQNVVFPDGWSGTFECDRDGSAIDDYFADVEANYYAGVDTGVITITETVVEPSGAVSQFQYTNVSLKFDNAGESVGDDTIHQTLSWMAERRIKLS